MKIEGLGSYNPQNSINTSKQVSDDTSFGSALQKAFDEKDKTMLKEACTEFETIMLKMLYKQIKATVPQGGLTEESPARSIFQDMMDDELMNEGGARGMGIADMMYKQLSSKMDRIYKPADTAASETKPAEGEKPETASENGAEPFEK